MSVSELLYKIMEMCEEQKKVNADEIVTRRILAEELLSFEERLDDKLEVRFKEQSEEYMRHISALSEDFQAKLGAVAENVHSIMIDMSFIKELLAEHSELHKQASFRLNALEASS